MIINVSWRKRRWFCKLHQTENEVPAFYREVYRNLIVQFVKSFVKIWFLLGNIQQFKILLNGKIKVQTPITFRVGFSISFYSIARDNFIWNVEGNCCWRMKYEIESHSAFELRISFELRRGEAKMNSCDKNEYSWRTLGYFEDRPYPAGSLLSWYLHLKIDQIKREIGWTKQI